MKIYSVKLNCCSLAAGNVKKLKFGIILNNLQESKINANLEGYLYYVSNLIEIADEYLAFAS